MNVTNNTIAAAARRERLSRLGILEEPMGYVDGVNLYQFVGSEPVSSRDPYGLKGEKEYPVNDPDSGDRQGTVSISVVPKNLCQPGEKGSLDVTVQYKLDLGLDGKPGDMGAVLINGVNTPISDVPESDRREFVAKSGVDIPAGTEGRSGQAYAATVWNAAKVAKEDDEQGKGKSGVIHAFTVKWSYECHCGEVANFKTEVKYDEDKGGNLPTTRPTTRPSTQPTNR